MKDIHSIPVNFATGVNVYGLHMYNVCIAYSVKPFSGIMVLACGCDVYCVDNAQERERAIQ